MIGGFNMNYTGTGYQTPELEFYEQRTVENSNVIFCPNCGAVNHIVLNWYGGIRGISFCAVCGKEIG